MRLLARPPHLGLSIGLFLAAGCGDSRAAQIACQERLLEASAGAGPSAAAFERIRDNLVAMRRDGCSERQRGFATAAARIASRIAASLRRFGDLRRLAESGPELRSNQAFMELMVELEGWEHRRTMMRRELATMKSEGRGSNDTE